MAAHTRIAADQVTTASASGRVVTWCRVATTTSTASDDVAKPVWLIVGHTDSVRGWVVDPVHTALTDNIDAGDSWTIDIEDYLEHRVWIDGFVKITNPQSRTLNVVLTRTVDGETGSYVLANEGLSNHDLLELTLQQTAPYGIRTQDTPVQLRHSLVISNNETEDSAKVAVILGGWAPRLTRLPVNLSERTP